MGIQSSALDNLYGDGNRSLQLISSQREQNGASCSNSLLWPIRMALLYSTAMGKKMTMAGAMLRSISHDSVYAGMVIPQRFASTGTRPYCL